MNDAKVILCNINIMLIVGALQAIDKEKLLTEKEFLELIQEELEEQKSFELL